MAKKTTRLDKIINWLKNNSLTSILGLIILALLLGGQIADSTMKMGDLYVRFFAKEMISDDKILKNKATDLAREIINFSNNRRLNEPEIDFDQWDESTRASSQYHTETMNIYYLNYLVRVTELRYEFLKRGINDKELDMIYNFPTNYFGLRDVSIGLVNLANKLESNNSINQIT